MADIALLVLELMQLRGRLPGEITYITGISAFDKVYDQFGLELFTERDCQSSSPT